MRLPLVYQNTSQNTSVKKRNRHTGEVCLFPPPCQFQGGTTRTKERKERKERKETYFS